MPQASDELTAKFPGSDGEALEALKPNLYADKTGIIRRHDKTIRPTARQFDAIDYLCDEWDYGWEGLDTPEGK